MPDYLGLPVLASEHGATIDELNLIVHAIMVGAFVLWGLFFVVPLFRYRKARRPQAVYRGLRSPIPFVMCAIMAALEGWLLLGYSIPFWDEHIAVGEVADEDVFRVRIIAEQFQWTIHYPGPDGLFSRTDIMLIDDQLNPQGLDYDDPKGEDDIALRMMLHLPVNRPVEIMLSSKDVIHSLWLPEFRVKQDAIPGMVIPVRFTPTMTSAEFQAVSGDDTRGFEIACAQLCGLGHFRMRGFITVETQAEFDAWYAEELEYKQDEFF